MDVNSGIDGPENYGGDFVAIVEIVDPDEGTVLSGLVAIVTQALKDYLPSNFKVNVDVREVERT